jgi:hypothetical protein
VRALPVLPGHPEPQTLKKAAPHLRAHTGLSRNACHMREVRAPLPAVQAVLPRHAHVHALRSGFGVFRFWVCGGRPRGPSTPSPCT